MIPILARIARDANLCNDEPNLTFDRGFAMDEKRKLRRFKWVIGMPYFAQGMSHLSEIPTLYFIKFVLKMGDADGQLFQALKSLGWLVKPLWGAMSDTIPLFGYYRKSWFVLMSFLSLVFWALNAGLAFAGIAVPFLYLITFNLAFMTYAFVDVVTDALMVEEGRRLGRVGSFVNFQWTMLALSNMVASFASGWFQEKINAGEFALGAVFLLTGILPLATAIVGIRNITEEKTPHSVPWGAIGSKTASASWRIGIALVRSLSIKNLRAYGSAFNAFRRDNKVMWYLVLFIFFWKFSPSIGYIQDSYAIDVRGFTPSAFGIIRGIGGGVTFLLSILAYTWVVQHVRRIQWHHYLYAMILIGVASFPLSFYSYLEPNHPWWDTVMLTLPDSLNPLPQWNRYQWFRLLTDIILGFATIPAFMIPLTIAGETIKIKNAGMSYAFLMSLSNVTNTLNDMLGAWLYRFLSQPRLEWLFDKFYLSFADIAGSPAIRTMILQIFVYIGLLFTIAGTVFVYLLKKELDANNISVNLAASD